MSDQQASAINHPGPILRAARDELRLSVEVVAEKLHLRPSVVALIESESYEDFSSDVFLKGYFRSYCRLVGLHEERMVELLERQLEAIQTEKQAAQKKEEDDVTKQRRLHLLKLVSVTVGIVGFGVLVIWALLTQQSPDSAADSSPGISNQSFVADDNSNETMSSDVMDEEGAADSASFGEASSTDEAIGLENESEPVIVIDEKQTASEVLGEQNGSAPVVTNDGSASFIDSQENSDLGSSLPQENEVLSQDGAVSALPSVQVDITFSGDCWFEAYGPDSDRIEAALKREGGTFRYQGVGPLRLILGDGRNAEILVNGEVYDFTNRIRNSGRAEVIIE